MQAYLNLLRHILRHGVSKSDRTGTGTQSVFGYDMRFDLRHSFPLVTTKKLHLRSIIYELLWFLQGHTNVQYLRDHQVSIWDAWADKDGNLGPIYGKQWVAWETKEGDTINQLSQLLTDIKTHPDSRRLIVSAWNVGELAHMALPPCHLLCQFYVAHGYLSCKLTQRSADVFLGLPFNIASYALLTYMIAQQCDLKPGEFIWSGGDCHIYHNHQQQVALQLSREPLPLAKLVITTKPASLFDYQFEHFRFENYQFHPAINAPIAI